MQPEFVAEEAGDQAVESICHSAWNGLRRGDTRVDSTNRTHFLVQLGVDRLTVVEQAFAALVARHPVLACRVEERQGAPWLIPSKAAPIDFVQAFSLAAGGRRAGAERAVGDIVWRRFDLDHESLSRPFVVLLDGRAAWFGLVVHHFVADAFSVGILRSDFLRLHRIVATGAPLPTAEPGVRYQDYLLGIRRWVDSDAGRSRRAALVDRVAGFPDMSFPRSDPAASEEQFTLNSIVASHVRDLARNLRTTSYTILLAAQAAVLREMVGRERVAMKIITSGRDASPLVRTVGNLADRQPLLIDLHGDPSFIDVVRRVRESLALCRRDAFVRDDFLQADLAASGISISAPVVNYRFIRQRPTDRAPSRSSLQVPRIAGIRTLPRDSFYLELKETVSGLSGTIRYGAGRLPGLLSWFEQFIAVAYRSPDEPISVMLRRSEPRC